ncbi:MAG: response regulator [Hyphomonadaceae bacterium]
MSAPIKNYSERTVIVVDDDEAVRDSLSILLSLSGFEVLTFKSGYELLGGLALQGIDCLIIDVNMPGMSGPQLVEALTTGGYKIPVILISGNIDSSTRIVAEQLGVTNLLEKPFSDAQLFAAIDAAMN